MKYALILLLLLLGSCSSAAWRTSVAGVTSLPPSEGVSPLPPWPGTAQPALQGTWEKQFDNHGNADMAWAIVETPEGDLVAVGITGPTPCQLGCNWDGWVIKTDAQGHLLWTRQYGGNGADLLTSVILSGHDYVMTGSKYVFPYARQAWLLKITPDGNLLWEKTFGGEQDDSGTDLIAIPQGGWFMIGQTKSFGSRNGGADVWLVRLDANGNTVWSQTYDLGGEDMGTSLAPFQRDSYIITAITCTGNCGELLQQGFASYLVIDSTGKVLKTQTFTEGKKNKFMKIKPTEDGGAVIVGATSAREKFPSEDTWLVKLDANANISWMKILESYGAYDGGLDIVQTPDGGYVIAAYSQIYQTPSMNYDNFWMLRLSDKGDVLWTRLWGGPHNDDARALTPTLDGGFVLAGFRDAVSWPLDEIPGPADFYLVKTTANAQRTFLPLGFGDTH